MIINHDRKNQNVWPSNPINKPIYEHNGQLFTGKPIMQGPHHKLDLTPLTDDEIKTLQSCGLFKGYI